MKLLDSLSESNRNVFLMYIYIYVYIHIYTYMYIYIYGTPVSKQNIVFIPARNNNIHFAIVFKSAVGPLSHLSYEYLGIFLRGKASQTWITVVGLSTGQRYRGSTLGRGKRFPFFLKRLEFSWGPARLLGKVYLSVLKRPQHEAHNLHIVMPR